MTPNLLQTAKIRRLILIEKRRLKEEMRRTRHRRVSERTKPAQNLVHSKSA